MIDFLNQNQGLVSIAGIVISVIITIIGFFITNKNITKIKQSQQLGAGAKGLQARRDAIDNSHNVYYIQNIEQEKRDYGIIEEILNCLFSADLEGLDLEESSNGRGLKKNNINFSDIDLRTIDDITLKTFEKKEIVKKFVNDQREINESKIDGLVIQLQSVFRNFKNTKNCYEKIEDYRIIELIADSCIDEAKKTNPEYKMNALSVVLYFFEMCDFGMSDDK